jgi:hypothetical protein
MLPGPHSCSWLNILFLYCVVAVSTNSRLLVEVQLHGARTGCAATCRNAAKGSSHICADAAAFYAQVASLLQLALRSLLCMGHQVLQYLGRDGTGTVYSLLLPLLLLPVFKLLCAWQCAHGVCCAWDTRCYSMGTGPRPGYAALAAFLQLTGHPVPVLCCGGLYQQSVVGGGSTAHCTNRMCSHLQKRGQVRAAARHCCCCYLRSSC